VRILVIGSEGHIGRHLVALLKKSHYVARVDRLPGHEQGYFCADIRDGLDLSRVFEIVCPDVVYNLAGMVSRVTSEAATQATLRMNVEGAHNVASLCKCAGSALVHYSTSEVYGNTSELLDERRACHPNNWYGLTNLLAESVVQYVRERNVCVVRPVMLYHEDECDGDHRSFMIRACKYIHRGTNFQLHRGSARSWCHMEDAVKAMALIGKRLVDRLEVPEIVNIGHPDMQEMSELVKFFEIEFRKSAEFTTVELPARMTAVKRPDLRRIFSLGWQPEIDLRTGVGRVAKFYRRRYGQE